MKQDIIGQGWAFPPDLDRKGGIALAKGDAEITQAIQIILMTSPGQRVMRPDFGCRVHELLFQPNNDHSASQARRYVEEALGRWEPRINVLDVQATPDEHRRHCLLINIQYEIKATHDKRSLVHPFYLIPEE